LKWKRIHYRQSGSKIREKERLKKPSNSASAIASESTANTRKRFWRAYFANIDRKQDNEIQWKSLQEKKKKKTQQVKQAIDHCDANREKMKGNERKGWSGSRQETENKGKGKEKANHAS